MEKDLSKVINWRLRKSIKDRVFLFSETGYTGISEKDLWEYLIDYRWKRSRPKTISEMKEDIKSILPNDFFDYQQLKAVTKLTFEDLDKLL